MTTSCKKVRVELKLNLFNLLFLDYKVKTLQKICIIKERFFKITICFKIIVKIKLKREMMLQEKFNI